MKANEPLVVLLVAYLCTSCFWDSSSDTITGKYSTLWIDTEANRMLCEETENPGSWNTLIVSYVFAVGHNNRFIIATQHPAGNEDNINTKVTRYYIIDIRDTDPKVLGPHSREAYEKLANKLEIAGLPFDQVYLETL